MLRFSSDRIARVRKPLTVVVLGVSVLVLAGATPPVRTCELAADWVKANIRDLPNSRADIQLSAAPWRRAIFAELPADVRVRLSREHLNEFSAKGTLSEPQRAFLREVDRSIERIQGLPRQLAEGEIARHWMPRVQLVFPGDRKLQASRIFYQTSMGPDADGLHPVVVRASLVPGFASHYVRQFARKAVPSVFDLDCNCRRAVAA
jgi:hypothetical protein